MTDSDKTSMCNKKKLNINASEEQQQLASFLKEVHSSLRKSCTTMGATQAWRQHCQNIKLLSAYAQSMETLATKYWEEKYSNETCPITSRIKWCADLSIDYFVNKSYIKHKEKEMQIGSKMCKLLDTSECFTEPLKLLDVGSCYNPFKKYNILDVLAIDLCPANDTVLQCDFLEIPVGSEIIIEDKKLKQIQQNSFEIVAFCFVLEYIPTSQLRMKACEKAYSILKPGGLLLITSPDSKHVGANCKIMKCWQYTLALMGFIRIQYEKLTHMHCMAFRKCLHKDIAVRWADMHKKSYMEYSLHIPQDFQNDNDTENITNIFPEIEVSPEDFKELPFYD